MTACLEFKYDIGSIIADRGLHEPEITKAGS